MITIIQLQYLFRVAFRTRYEDYESHTEAELYINLIVDVVRLEILQTDEHQQSKQKTEQSQCDSYIHVNSKLCRQSTLWKYNEKTFNAILKNFACDQLSKVKIYFNSF